MIDFHLLHLLSGSYISEANIFSRRGNSV